MATRKLVRDLILSTRPSYAQLLYSRKVSASSTRLRLLSQNGYLGNRQFSVFNEFSKNLKEATKNEDLQKSIKELKEKTEELKAKKEDLTVRAKQNTEQLYKKVDGAFTEAGATAKKVSANLKEKISAATEEVKDSFGIGKQDPSQSTASSAESTSSTAKDSTGTGTKSGPKSTAEEEKQKQSGAGDAAETFFHKFRSSIPSVPPQVSAAFQKVKLASPIDLAKKGYGIVKDELSGNPSKRKLIEYEASEQTSSSKVERSIRTDVTIVPTKQSKFSKKWETLKEKMRSHPMFKRVSGLSEPVVVKSQELADDIRDRWETTDNPVVHKIQDLSENVLGETATALSFKEIRRRDPSFSLPDFVSEVQEVIKPVLKAYFKGDAEVLKKYCTKEVIERCKAEHKAYETQGIFFENKILHISDAEVRETKMMGDTPLIIVMFQTQQVYCVRDRQGAVKEGSTDTIHTVYYAWAMQQIDVEELGEGALFPVWRLREMQQLGVQALI